MPRRDDRTSYKLAGIAGRWTLKAAAQAHPALKSAEWRVVVAVVSLTALYSKLEDGIAVAQVAEFVGMHPKTVAPHLRSLNARSDIPIRFEAGIGRGNYSMISIRDALEKGSASSPSTVPLSEEKGSDTTPDSAPFPSVKESTNTPNTAPLSTDEKGALRTEKGAKRGSKGSAFAPGGRDTEGLLPSSPSEARFEKIQRHDCDVCDQGWIEDGDGRLRRCPSERVDA
jgi:hypothetical protein